MPVVASHPQFADAHSGHPGTPPSLYVHCMFGSQSVQDPAGGVEGHSLASHFQRIEFASHLQTASASGSDAA